MAGENVLHCSSREPTKTFMSSEREMTPGYLQPQISVSWYHQPNSAHVVWATLSLGRIKGRSTRDHFNYSRQYWQITSWYLQMWREMRSKWSRLLYASISSDFSTTPFRCIRGFTAPSSTTVCSWRAANVLSALRLFCHASWARTTEDCQRTQEGMSIARSGVQTGSYIHWVYHKLEQ
jgi:hypothetical protein